MVDNTNCFSALFIVARPDRQCQRVEREGLKRPHGSSLWSSVAIPRFSRNPIPLGMGEDVNINNKCILHKEL